MDITDFMEILQKDMKVAVFATVDKDGKPHARHAHIGFADQHGVFFMTSPTTNFYQQLTDNPYIALTALKEEAYLIQVIRIEGKVKPIDKDGLQDILADNPFIQHVYPDDSVRSGVQVFHLYEGEGFYHSLTQGHKYTFKIGTN